VCQLSELACLLLVSRLSASSAAGIISFVQNESYAKLLIVTMAVKENRTSAPEGSIDPNCPVFPQLSIEASWDDAERSVSNPFGFTFKPLKYLMYFSFLTLGLIYFVYKLCIARLMALISRLRSWSLNKKLDMKIFTL